MKKKTTLHPIKKPKHNPVAKHAGKFNKATVHQDKTKYTRKNKHQQDTKE
tara:strand:+ start:145111 stop:145260 length:150 start_codon:yes stop_codon:yes gene_type:complete